MLRPYSIPHCPCQPSADDQCPPHEAGFARQYEFAIRSLIVIGRNVPGLTIASDPGCHRSAFTPNRYSSISRRPCRNRFRCRSYCSIASAVGPVPVYALKPSSARSALIAFWKPVLSLAASAASATIRCSSRAERKVSGPQRVLLRKPSALFKRNRVTSGSALLSSGSLRARLSTTIVLPPVEQPETVQIGYTYTDPIRISCRSFTSNPISVLIVVGS